MDTESQIDSTSESTSNEEILSNEGPALLSLEELQTKLGKASEVECDALIAGQDDGSLAEAGRKIASNKIVADAKRIYNQAYTYWQNATPSQRASLRGFSELLLRVAVGQAFALEQLSSAFMNARKAKVTPTVEREQQIKTATERAIALRAQLHAVINTVAGRDADAQTKLEQIQLPPSSVKGIVDSTKQLIELGRALILDASPAMKIRVVAASLSEEYLAETDAEMQKFATNIADLQSRPDAPPISQPVIDYLDGVNLYLLRAVVRAFDTAHTLYGSVPKLVPVATKAALSAKKKVEKPKEKAASEPAKSTDAAPENPSSVAA